MYSKEFRREVAMRFDVSESWVRRIKQERRELGKTSPKMTRDLRPSCRLG
jgi:transposase